MSTEFSKIIQYIAKGQKRAKPLIYEEAYNAMNLILEQKATPSQIGAFFTILRYRYETPQEVAGFLQATKDFYQLDQTDKKIDICIGSYAGKRFDIPYYMLSLDKLAKEGYKILLHCHKPKNSFGERIYPIELVNTLGWDIAKDANDAMDILKNKNICVLPLSGFAPYLIDLMDYREELGLRSFVHSLVRMLNPINTNINIQGVFHKGYDKTHIEIAKETYEQNNNKVKTISFCGENGEPEILVSKNTKIYTHQSGEIKEFEVNKIDTKTSRLDGNDLLKEAIVKLEQAILTPQNYPEIKHNLDFYHGILEDL